MITAGNSLAVQWLGLSPFNTGARVQSLVRELRSHKLRGIAKHKQTKMTTAFKWLLSSFSSLFNYLNFNTPVMGTI